MKPENNTTIEQINKLQQLASDPKSSIYVSASAGTGKTKILVDRYIRLMLAGASPESILCLTFTNAAAQEMKARIVAKLQHYKTCSEEVLLHELSQIGEAHRKPISVRQLYQKFINELDKIKVQTIHSFANGVVSWINKDRLSFVNIIEKARFDSMLGDCIESYFVINPQSQLYRKFELNQIFDFVKELHYQTLQKGSFECHDLTAIIKPDLPVVEFHHEYLDKVVQSKDLSLIKRVFLTQNLEPRAKVLNKQELNGAINLEDKIKYYQSRFMEYLSAISHHEIMKQSNELLKLYEYFSEKLSEYKQATSEFEYDDILVQFMKILDDEPHILRALDYNIDHVLVDEAQDLSPRQWGAILKITEEFFVGHSQREENRTVFIVGDFKQSIYSFQGADPSIFMGIREYYANRVKAVQANWIEVELHHSFRSVMPILNFVDSLFNQLQLNSALGSEDKIEHKPTRTGNGEVRLYKLFTIANKEEIEDWDLPKLEDSDNAKTNLIKSISALVKQKIKLEGVAPEDIMILFRKRGGLYNSLANELKKSGIEVSLEDKSLPHEHIVIQDLLLLADVYGYPHDRYKLACFLKSPFVGMNEQELLAAIESYELQKLNFTSMQQLYNRYLFETNAIARFITRFGAGVVQIITFFLTKLVEFEQLFGPAVSLLSSWFKQNIVEFSFDHHQRGVQMMTAHSAKGLQAKVVILADAASSEQQPVESLLFHESKIYLATGVDQLSDLTKDIKANANLQNYAESMRLLYVALTRAENELHVFGLKNNRVNNSWYDLINRLAEAEDPNFVDVSATSQNNQTKSFAAENMSFQQFNHIAQDQSNRSQIIGTVTHKILEFYGKPFALNAINSWAKKLLGDKDFEIVYNKAVRFAESYPHLFGPNSKAEWPISATMDDIKHNVRIDRLIFENDHLLIVDFKTDAKQNDEAHRQQLMLYKRLVESLYNKPAKVFIGWISSLELQELN